DDRHLHGIDPRRAGAIRRTGDDQPGLRRDCLRRRGDPDHVRGTFIRSAADVGCRTGARRMSDQPEPQHPTAEVHTRGGWRRLSLIWAIPLVTAVIGAWLAWDTLSQRGPLITISFESAEGLQAGQSHVRYKAVDMGLVDSIALTPDQQR